MILPCTSSFPRPAGAEYSRIPGNLGLVVGVLMMAEEQGAMDLETVGLALTVFRKMCLEA